MGIFAQLNELLLVAYNEHLTRCPVHVYSYNSFCSQWDCTNRRKCVALCTEHVKNNKKHTIEESYSNTHSKLNNNI